MGVIGRLGNKLKSRTQTGRLASGGTIGSGPALQREPVGRIHVAPGSYIVNGQSVSTLHAWETPITGGSYAVTGSAVTFIDSVQDAAGGEELILGETDAMGIDFTYDTDRSLQMSVITSSVEVSSDPYSTLTYTSPSIKMCRQSDGVWRYGNHNLVLQSQTFGTTWGTEATVTANTTVAPDGTTTADTLTETNGAGFQRLYQQVTFPAGVPCTISVYAKAGSGTRYPVLALVDLTGPSSFTAIYDLSGGGSVTKTQDDGTGGLYIASSITSVGGGWYRLTLTGQVGTANPYMIIQFTDNSTDTIDPSNGETDFTGDGTGSIIFWGAEMKRFPVSETGPTSGGVTGYIATVAAQRFDLPYEWDVNGDPQGILIEEARTNNLQRSQEFDNAYWTKSGTAASANATTAPDGTTTAETLTSTSGSSVHQCFGTSITGLSSNAAYTLSCFVKKGTHRYVALASSDTATGGETFAAVFDLDGGGSTATELNNASTTAIASSQIDAGNGWFRLSVSASNNSSTAHVQSIQFVGAATGNSFGAYSAVTYNAAGTETIHVWGAQYEAGSFPTSPIHTIGATVTRADDNISLATSAFPYSSTNSTVIIYANAKQVTSENYWWQLHQGGNERSQLYVTAGNPIMSNVAGGAQDVATDLGTVVVGTPTKIAIALKANDFAGCQDGGSVGSDASATMPTAATVLQFNENASKIPNYHLRQITYLPRRATNGELQTRTT